MRAHYWIVTENADSLIYQDTKKNKSIVYRRANALKFL